MNRRSMIRDITLAILILAAISSLTGCARPSASGKLDVASKKIVARLDGAPIREGDVNRRILAAYGQVDRKTVPPSRWQMMVETATDSEIMDRLLLRAARADGMIVPKGVVDALIQTSRHQLGEENFTKMLKERKASEDEFRTFLEERELIGQFKAKLFGGIAIDQKTVREYYAGHLKDFTMPDSARLEVIVAATIEKADELHRKWRDGKSFDVLAGEAGTIDGNPAARRLRWTPYEAMPPELGQKVMAAAKSEILTPVESGKKFLVVRVLEKRTARPMTFEEANEDVRRALILKKEQEILDRWQEGEMRKAKIEYIR